MIRALAPPDVRKTIANVARTGLVEDFRGNILETHGVCQQGRDILDTIGASATDVDDLACRLRLLEREAKGLGDIANMDEIAPLIAVFEDHRRLMVRQSGGKIGEHTGIGVGQRLTCAEDVEQAERHGLHPIGFREDQALPFLRVFGERIDGGEIYRLFFIGRNRNEGLAVLGAEIPLAALHLLRPAAQEAEHVAIRFSVAAFSVDTHGGGNDQLLDRLVDHRFQQNGSAEIICTDVAGDLVHGLADPDLGGEMDDPGHAFQSFVDHVPVAHIAPDDLDTFRQCSLRVAMHLIDQGI